MNVIIFVLFIPFPHPLTSPPAFPSTCQKASPTAPSLAQPSPSSWPFVVVVPASRMLEQPLATAVPKPLSSVAQAT